jgi:pantoate--beta-alanine ligase
VTIFVNPRQFTVADDYTKYPRNEARDLAIAEAEGVDIVFAPDASEIYPPGFDTVVSVGAVARPLEGAARPGHFDGVATVVAILFDLVGADHAYFGQKDAQQVMVIRQMARDLAIATQVIACPTVREPDGLALSSRNVHLSPEERAAAPVLRRALLAARDRWEAGERSADALRDAMWETLTAEPLADVDYVSVADGTTLAELDRIDGPALLSLAVRFGTTRLIDNELLEPETGA